MNIELSVIVPCYNEEGNLPELVERIERVFDRKGIRGEIVLVNDGSRDGTGAQIEALAASHPRVVGVHHPTNRGIPAGWKSGLDHSRGRYVLTIDADLQNQPEAIAQLWREMKISNVDVVQGWRSLLERHDYDIRYYMSRGLDLLLRFLFRMTQHDIKSGFVLYKREAFEEILAHAPHYRYFQTFILVVAKAKGYSIRQVETLFDARLVGKSFISFLPVGVIVGVLADISRAFYEFRLREPKEQTLALALHGKPEPAQVRRETGWRKAYFRLYGALMPVHHWMISRNAIHYLEELRRTQWLSRQEVRDLQEKRLRRLVQHAYDHVGYYRDLLDENGIRPEEIRTIEDLQRIPILTKKLLRENLYFDLLSDNHDKRKIQKIQTSGSTGEPLAMFCDRFQLDMRWATTFRNVEWTGYHFPDRQVRLWHSTIGLNGIQAMKEHLDAWMSGRKFFSVFALDSDALSRYVDFVRTNRPALLDGYAEAFNVVAHLLQQHPAGDLKAGAIISSAQTLPPETRALIEQKFGCKVFDKYGAREFSGIAHECEKHEGYHVNAESYIVEVMRDGRPAREGEVGEVLVTDLNNSCVPMIRYKLGDLAMVTDHQCSCGRGLPLIRKVIGRLQSVVLGTNGRYLPATYFAHFFKEYEYAVSRYQVVQEARDRLDVRLITKSRFTAETEEKIRSELLRVLGSDMHIQLRPVDKLEQGRTGKIQACISRIEMPLFSADAAEAWEDQARREAAAS